MGVSKSGYYRFKQHRVSAQKMRKHHIQLQISRHFLASKRIYGAPKITVLLQREGIHVTEKTVGNYMREKGLRAIWTKKYTRTTINPDFDTQLTNVLQRNFTPDKPNTVWVTDITYVHTQAGFVYLTSFMDLFSRKIISWHVHSSLETTHVLTALTAAKDARQFDEPLVIHSDRGCQFVSEAYKKETPLATFIRSYSQKATPWDNACIESFHALIKREWLHRYVIKDLTHARALIFEYIETFYNTQRIHSYCGYVSPYDFEHQFYTVSNS
jgi:putative transposase